MHGNRIALLVIASIALASSPASARSIGVGLSRAEALYQRTEYDRVIGELESLEEKAAAAYALLGKAYYMQGRYREAIANLEKASAADSRNSEYQDWLGKAYGRLAETSSFVSAYGHARKTVRAFERAVELGPTNLEALSDVFEFYLQAPAIVGGGVDKAERIAARVASLDEPESHWMRARLAEKRKDYPAAEREFRAAAAAAPDQAGRALDLAAFLSSRGRHAESEAIFQEAEGRYPASPKVLFARATAYVQGNRKLDCAQALLEKYLHLPITPDDPSRREAAALLKTARERSRGSARQSSGL